MTIKRFFVVPEDSYVTLEDVYNEYGDCVDADMAQELYDTAVELLNRLEADKDVITKDWWVSERNKLATAIIKIRGE